MWSCFSASTVTAARPVPIGCHHEWKVRSVVRSISIPSMKTDIISEPTETSSAIRMTRVSAQLAESESASLHNYCDVQFCTNTEFNCPKRWTDNIIRESD
jgi:hypothetical protein